MRIKRMVIISILIMLTGCSNTGDVNQAYNQAMQKAKEAIVEKKFDQAEGFVELALESNSTNKEAKNILGQLTTYIEGTDLNEAKEYEKAQEKFQLVSESKGASEKLSSYAKEELERLTLLLETEKELATEFAEAKKLSDEQKYVESNAKLEPMVKTDFSLIRDTVLKETIQTVVDENKAKLEELAKIVVHNKEEAAQRLAEGMPQVAGAHFVEEKEGIYYFTIVSALARWELTVNQFGELTEKVIEDLSPAAKGIDWEQIARDKVTSQFPEFEVSNFEEAGDNLMNVFIRNKGTGQVASHAVGSINIVTGVISGF